MGKVSFFGFFLPLKGRGGEGALCALVLAAAFIFFGGTAYAGGAVQLPQSGQKQCYDVNGTVITCPGTGQDGAKQMGAAWPNPRFTDNNNGTVTDNLTGLIWLKNADCFGNETWDQALAFANNLADGQCGLADGSQPGDWRLPNINELRSLVNSGYNEATCGSSSCGSLSNWLNTQGFSQVQSLFYWSSTTLAYHAGDAWFVGMGYGDVGGDGRADDYLYVWPVRGGQ